ncbi:MAG TPA: heavy metal translocating P-type ATPase [Ignavibacteriaceae bacterium]|nr:heavy metal translocating P-type ATPase [Ignavibacteriaceae bacterium]
MKPKLIIPEKTAIRKELTTLLVVVVLFIVGLFFNDELHKTPFSIGEYLIFIPAYLLSGWTVLSKALKNLFLGKIFDENFLMTIATLGAIAIGELPEAVGVMVFYNLGEFIQGLSVKRSRKSIRKLLEIRPDYANLKIGNEIKKVQPEDVKVGEEIIIKPGEKIPLDGEVIEGSSFVDTFPLTGEPVPRSVKINDDVLAGMINKSGVISVRVTKLFGESSISKILELVESASKKKAKAEKFISRFASYYTPIVVGIALLIAFIPPLFLSAQTYSEWIYRALVILVISCPCALVISIPLGYFGGVGGASRKGILVKGSNFLDALTEVKTVVFDKTGTLTKGVFKVTEIVVSNGLGKDQLLYYAAAAEAHSSHPIAIAIREAYDKDVKTSELINVEEIAGYGIKAKVDNKNIIVGNDRMLHFQNINHHNNNCAVEGTVVHIAVDNNYAGYIKISDEIKEDSIRAIKELRDLGIEEIIMLTGDNKFSADNIAGKIGIGTTHSELLPEDKVGLLEKIMAKSSKGKKVAFVGDGINDAPVIMRADVGIAMGGLGSDAAVEAADIVLMEDHPSKVAEAIKIARKTRTIVWQNILFALGVKAFFITLGSFGIASMWEAVFADMGVALIAIANATRVLRN